MNGRTPLTGVVLTGGRSRRMGSDKATHEVDGVAMAVRVAAALTEAGCSPVLCLGGDVPALEALGLKAMPDTRPGAGPVAAIAQAIRIAAPHSVMVAACDLVDLDPATVVGLIDAARQHPDAAAVVAVDGDGPHLLAVFQGANSEQLEMLDANGVTAYRAVVRTLDAVEVVCSPAALRNINRQDDLRARHADSLGGHGDQRDHGR